VEDHPTLEVDVSDKTKLVDVAKGDISISEAQEAVDLVKLKSLLELGNAQADLDWKKAYYSLRTIWAFLTIILLGLVLWFTFWLVREIGIGKLNFQNYKTFLNIVAGSILIDILGLVAIVMHFLFPPDKNNHK
jgi:hypothetical protein